MPGRKSAARGNPTWDHEFHTLRREKLFRNPPKDQTAFPTLAAAINPHIHSFDAIFEPDGLIRHALKDIGEKSFFDRALDDEDPTRARNKITIRISDVFLEPPTLPPTNRNSVRDRRILPSECRERHCTYRGKLRARLEFKINGGEWKESVREMGQLPVMLRTNRCHLQKLSPADLVAAKEESEELGGYFIVNGNERLIRMLIVAKRNYPMAIVRTSFQKRGSTYTDFGVQIRSARPDQTSITNTLHYLTDGNVTFRFSWRKNEYLLPVMMVLKALVETNDREIFEGILGKPRAGSAESRQVTADRIELLLRTFKHYSLRTKAGTRAYIGQRFRVVLGVSEDISDEDVGTEFLRRVVLPHLGNADVTLDQDADKFRMLLFMTRKLYSLVEGECVAENPDAVSHQELLLGGFLYGMIIKEKLEDWIGAIGSSLAEWSGRRNVADPQRSFASKDFEKGFISKILVKSGENIGGLIEYFLSTGNLVTTSGLDLQQTSGYTVVAEKINFYRFISHFRMVHRGSFFAELKTTTVRKLLPESWGFLCPIHTPDGAPCGLLNHLSHKCLVATHNSNVSSIPQLISELGVESGSSGGIKDDVVVQLDGRVLGFCSPKQAQIIQDTLRYWKVEGGHGVPRDLELGYVPVSNGGQYPGIYMFSHSARMYRPTKYLPLDKTDFVGPFEQPFMSIACTESEVVSGDSTHVEFDPTNILSIVANQTPFSDFNQSPRNMYQCQMGKQSMGTPGTALRYRTDNKTYRLQTGQTPIVRPPLYNEYGLDNFPNGMNAVVAVISYTGYDMDDAMIINKSAHERGFGNGAIFKTKKYNIAEQARGRTSATSIPNLFGFPQRSPKRKEHKALFDDDGLPHVGRLVREGEPMVAYHSVQYEPADQTFRNIDGVVEYMTYRDPEDAYVEEVRLIGSETGNDPCTQVSIKLRVPRSPVIGDKFSSRHGQKGVCSQKFPAVDMPFSESGIQPDVIINPHAFPSRMTIGMFVESLAGKAGALHGLAQDSTPFKFDEQDTAVDYFGKQLQKAGYNYYGNEPMYSGITGQELAADIYLGVVYYQRLRHMVNDKYQVRTTGPVNSMTGQPIKGRKKGGGVRVGEMERDALIAHGAAFLLQDRLMNCSDYTRSWICKGCGGFLGMTASKSDYGSRHKRFGGPMKCLICAKRATGQESINAVWEDAAGVKWTGGDDVTVVAVPSVLKYLDVELAAMGVKMRFQVDPI